MTPDLHIYRRKHCGAYPACRRRLILTSHGSLFSMFTSRTSVHSSGAGTLVGMRTKGRAPPETLAWETSSRTPWDKRESFDVLIASLFLSHPKHVRLAAILFHAHQNGIRYRHGNRRNFVRARERTDKNIIHSQGPAAVECGGGPPTGGLCGGSPTGGLCGGGGPPGLGGNCPGGGMPPCGGPMRGGGGMPGLIGIGGMWAPGGGIPRGGIIPPGGSIPTANKISDY